MAPAPSLWLEQLGRIDPGAPLASDIEADVAIIGGGFTGLWTAYYLKMLDPGLCVTLLEAEYCGYGASGRNGGWMMAAMEGEAAMLARLAPATAATCRSLVHGILAEVEQVLAATGIDCDYARGGGIYAAARYPEQARFMRDYLQEQYRSGFTEQDYRWMDADELASRLRLQRPYGAVYTPNIARIQPARLARGLRNVLVGLGVQVYEQSPVTGLDGPRVCIAGGSVRAAKRVLALEGYSGALAELRGRVIPLQSRIVATEPLSTAQWDEIGLQGKEVFSDASPLVTYGQRSADDRLVFGARGTYQFGGTRRSDFSGDSQQFGQVEALMLACLPQLEGVAITHRWGGNLGLARRGVPHAVFDPASGLATAGGYFGEGVGASNLMARTLVDLLLDRDTELTRAPWAHRAPLQRALARFEPEPLPWLGYRATDLARRAQERACSRGWPGSTQRVFGSIAGALDRLLG